MDLSTDYLGLKLKNPLVLAASPLTGDTDNFRKAEDAGIAAVVMHSLFEEQILQETNELEFRTFLGTESYPEALTYFPEPQEYILGPRQYLEQVRLAKKAVKIPVIASLNGATPGGWTRYAKDMADAGADALELNLYSLPANAGIPGGDVEKSYVDIVMSVRKQIDIPVAVKLSPFFSSPANVAKQMAEAGADALVLFNRFYQPDIDVEELQVTPRLRLSSEERNLLPLRWIAILYGRVKVGLAATGGILQARDVVKMVMAGADATMLCSVLLRKGIGHAAQVLGDLEQWLNEHEYDSLQKIKGIMSQQSCPAPEAFERANYMKVLGDYRGERTI